MPFCRFDPSLPLRDAGPPSVLFLRLTYRDSSIIMWHDGVSTTILVSSCDTTASQRPFWSHRATRWRLNDHLGPIVRHDGVSTAILVPSCDTTASQRPFWSHRATRWRLNGHLGLIVRHDGVSTTILVPSCDTTASQWSFRSHRATRWRLNGHSCCKHFRFTPYAWCGYVSRWIFWPWTTWPLSLSPSVGPLRTSTL